MGRPRGAKEKAKREEELGGERVERSAGERVAQHPPTQVLNTPQHYTSLNTPRHEVEEGVGGATSNLDTDESEEERREESGEHLLQHQRLEIALEDEEVEASSPSKD